MTNANPRSAMSSLLVVLPLALLSGCYSFTGGSLAYKTVAVPVAKNSTKEYRTTDAVTADLIAAITKDGRLKLMEAKDAESRFEIEITGYARDPYVYNSREVVSQYKVTITVKAAYLSQSGKTVWKNDSVSGWSTYQVDKGEDEAAGIEKAAQNLAAEILRQALETW
jgi:hypothetical protein